MGYKKLKLSNKVILVLCLPEKSSFTLSKLRFFALRKPKNPSCYTTSTRSEVARQICWTTSILFLLSGLESAMEATAAEVSSAEATAFATHHHWVEVATLTVTAIVDHLTLASATVVTQVV